jgi:Domain of unknown function (DUF2024)
MHGNFCINQLSSSEREETMSISHVYDTYAKTAKGRIMHFDVVIDEQNQEKALGYAKEWLSSIGHPDAVVSLENCAFCHSAEAPPAMREEIERQGYAIYKLEGCPA